MENLLVFNRTFITDGAVSAMYGVAYSVNGNPLYDITHEIPQYNIWEILIG